MAAWLTQGCHAHLPHPWASPQVPPVHPTEPQGTGLSGGWDVTQCPPQRRRSLKSPLCPACAPKHVTSPSGSFHVAPPPPLKRPPRDRGLPPAAPSYSGSDPADSYLEASSSSVPGGATAPSPPAAVPSLSCQLPAGPLWPLNSMAGFRPYFRSYGAGFGRDMPRPFL